MTNLQVQYFLVLSELKNFTATANYLHVSQPVISKQIASLESELGFPLFERSRKHVKLTPAGEIMLPFFSRYTDEYEEARALAMQTYSRFSSEVSFWMLQFYDNPLINAYIARSYQQDPNLSVYIERQFLPCTTEQVRRNRWDIAITFQDLAENLANYSFYELEKTHDLILISKKHRLANKPDLCASDFANEVFCHTGKIKGDLSGRFDQANRIETYHLNQCRTVSVSNMSSVLSNVETGHVFAIVESSVLPFVQFDYVGIDLPRENSIGLIAKTNSSNPYVKRFISGLLCYLEEHRQDLNRL